MAFITDVKLQIEIHKPARIDFKKRHVIMKSFNGVFQADLVEMISQANENDTYKYILVMFLKVCLDVSTKK